MDQEAYPMDAPTLDRMLSDLLLVDVSDGLDDTARQLGSLHESWSQAGADRASLDWLGELVANLYWWSGRLLGAASFASAEQGVPDNRPRPVVSS
jgi:hypothetical protein